MWRPDQVSDSHHREIRYGPQGQAAKDCLPELFAHSLALQSFHVEIVGPGRHDEEGNNCLLTAVHLGQGTQGHRDAGLNHAIAAKNYGTSDFLLYHNIGD